MKNKFTISISLTDGYGKQIGAQFQGSVLKALAQASEFIELAGYDGHTSCEEISKQIQSRTNKTK